MSTALQIMIEFIMAVRIKKTAFLKDSVGFIMCFIFVWSCIIYYECRDLQRYFLKIVNMFIPNKLCNV